MMLRSATLALAISIAIAATASAQSARSAHARSGADVSATASEHGASMADQHRPTTRASRAKGATNRSARAAEKSRQAAVYGTGTVDTTASGTVDPTSITGVSGTAGTTGTTGGTTDTTSMNNTPPRSEIAGAVEDVEAGVPARMSVPASPNASANARIATSAPGAMADYRHMTGAGRFHIDTNVLDVNHDGFLSREEASTNVTLDNQFATIDANADGRIATDELRSWISSGGLAKKSFPVGDLLSGVGAAGAFQMLDLDGDGMLTAKEAAVQRTLGPRFRSLDANRDGRLSQAEFDAWNRAAPRQR